MMKVEGLSLLITLLLAVGFNAQVPGNDYWERRASIVRSEENRRLGGDLKLESEQERLTNQTLMNAKLKELDDGFREPSTFLPAQSFMQVRNNISNSPVFKIIEIMPKGAVLHTHDYKMTSFDYVFHNITFRPNLYICDVNGNLRFRFFNKPGNDCQWQLLSDVRKNDKNGTIDERIEYHLSMPTKDFGGENNDAAWVHFRLVLVSANSLMAYRPVFEGYFYQGLLELYEDNVLYLELRSVIQSLYDLDGKVYGTLDAARIYKEVADKFVKDHPDFLGVKLIYSIPRSSNDSQMDEYISTAREIVKNLPGFLVGIDTIHQEDKSRPLADFVDKLRAVSKDVPLILHAGETKWNGQESDENFIDAVLLGTKRIGNGFGLTKHPEVLELALQKRIPVEVLPISNQMFSLVSDLRNHPASVLFANNYPVVISIDDPGLWGAKGLSYDFYEAFVGIMSRHADLRALKKLAINSIEYSSMNATEKNQAMQVWQRKWNQFVNEVATNL